MTIIAERILAAFCKDPREVSYYDTQDPQAAARREVPSEPLNELEREFPDLRAYVYNKDVLDFGCGWGDQAAAIAVRFDARVTGLDTHAGLLAAARERYGQRVRFIERLNGETFDIVITQDAMEHFDDPAAALAAMSRALRPDGRILMTFGPPWYAPYGTHANFFCPIPWLQLWFSEKTVMSVRGRYRKDGARHYEEVESGLNRMSLRKFERLTGASGLRAERLKYVGVKRMHFLTKIPIVRELTTVVVTGVFKKQRAD
jgi:ubiquinone/menaquinone biosynthesis C-methylase UbiE